LYKTDLFGKKNQVFNPGLSPTFSGFYPPSPFYGFDEREKYRRQTNLEGLVYISPKGFKHLREYFYFSALFPRTCGIER
jgi:hypothetical protein